jgi:hypothetical protein
VILQASAGARKYAGEAFIKHLIAAEPLEKIARSYAQGELAQTVV